MGRPPPWTEASNKGGVEKTRHFPDLNVNISKTTGDTSIVTINDWQEFAHALLIDSKIDDLEWPWAAISQNFLEFLCDFADFWGNSG